MSEKRWDGEGSGGLQVVIEAVVLERLSRKEE